MTRFRCISGSLLAMFFVALSSRTPAVARSAQTPADTLPEAAGKAVVLKVCTSCHGTDVMTDAPRTVPAWIDTVFSMKDFGAMGTDEEFKAVTDYLVVNLAHLQVNKATADEAAPVLGVDVKVAQGVVDYREKQGGFKTLDDLKRAPGLDAAKIDALAPRLLFGN